MAESLRCPRWHAPADVVASSSCSSSSGMMSPNRGRGSAPRRQPNRGRPATGLRSRWGAVDSLHQKKTLFECRAARGTASPRSRDSAPRRTLPQAVVRGPWEPRRRGQPAENAVRVARRRARGVVRPGPGERVAALRKEAPALGGRAPAEARRPRQRRWSQRQPLGRAAGLRDRLRRRGRAGSFGAPAWRAEALPGGGPAAVLGACAAAHRDRGQPHPSVCDAAAQHRDARGRASEREGSGCRIPGAPLRVPGPAPASARSRSRRRRRR